MKSCPTCNRTYDDSFTFCLDDGALLSAPHDPQVTLQIPAARNTNQAKTEILGPSSAPQYKPQAPRQGSAPATTPATDPFGYQQHVQTAPKKRGGSTKLIVGGVIAVLTACVLVLGYLVWQNNRTAQTTGSDAEDQSNADAGNRTLPTNANTSGDLEEEISVKPTPSSQWLEGVWEGTGTQISPKITWTIKLTVKNNSYKIEYPSLRCRGDWTLVEIKERKAMFKESITEGLERCSPEGDITIEKLSDSEVSYKYSLVFLGEVASGTLTRAPAR